MLIISQRAEWEGYTTCSQQCVAAQLFSAHDTHCFYRIVSCREVSGHETRSPPPKQTISHSSYVTRQLPLTAKHCILPMCNEAVAPAVALVRYIAPSAPQNKDSMASPGPCHVLRRDGTSEHGPGQAAELRIMNRYIGRLAWKESHPEAWVLPARSLGTRACRR